MTLSCDTAPEDMKLHTEIYADGKTYRAVSQHVHTPILDWPEHIQADEYKWTGGTFETLNAAEEAGVAEAERLGLNYLGVFSSTIPRILEI